MRPDGIVDGLMGPQPFPALGQPLGRVEHPIPLILVGPAAARQAVLPSRYGWGFAAPRRQATRISALLGRFEVPQGGSCSAVPPLQVTATALQPLATRLIRYPKRVVARRALEALERPLASAKQPGGLG